MALAIRSGVRCGRAGRKGFIWGMLFRGAVDRRRLLRSAVKDLSRIFIVAIVLDAVYQAMVLRAFYIAQALAVATVCAVLPYTIVRGPTAFITHLVCRRSSGPSAAPPS